MSKKEKLPKEFDHIEVKVIRNPEWLKHFSRQGFYLSEEFPVVDIALPEDLENIQEEDLHKLKSEIRGQLHKTNLVVIDYSDSDS